AFARTTVGRPSGRLFRCLWLKTRQIVGCLGGLTGGGKDGLLLALGTFPISTPSHREDFMRCYGWNLVRRRG
ncbi:MAG: hypothetical protein RLN85_19630, partial [Pseudomonadales bacterium]